jgi:hypothetical protein
MASPAPTTPLPELALDTTARLDRLTYLAGRAWNDVRRLVAASRIRDGNLGSNVVFYPPWTWEPLRAEQQPLADATVSAARGWLDAAERVIRLNEPTALKEFRQHSGVLWGIVDRSPVGNGRPPAGQLTEVMRAAEEAVIAQLDLLRALASTRRPPEWMWLPDTNALYDRHELHRWPSSKPTLLVLAPTVINELDAHKQDGRNPGRQQKARAIIEQIKDIRRRPDQVIHGRLRLRLTATWHRPWDELPNWLDRDHADDQILALGIELAWTSLSSAVTLITSDPNLQTKAEQVGLAYVDQDQPAALVASPVPDPVAGMYRAGSRLIYADFHRDPGDRFLAVDGSETMLQAHLDQGHIESA